MVPADTHRSRVGNRLKVGTPLYIKDAQCQLKSGSFTAFMLYSHRRVFGAFSVSSPNE